MTSTHSSAPSDPVCVNRADLALERARVVALRGQLAHTVSTSQMREAVLGEALLAAPDASEFAACKARAQADADQLEQIRATWWYRLFGRRIERDRQP